MYKQKQSLQPKKEYNTESQKVYIMNETTPLLSGSTTTTSIDNGIGVQQQQQQSEQSSSTTPTPTPTTTTPTTPTTTTTDAVVTEPSISDAIITKQNNIPIIEILALTAIISGSLSMYWGISGLLVIGTTTAASTILSIIISTILSQPMIIVHVIMSTCVVVLAPVVTVQKVQLRVLGTLRQQQNELRTQINTFNNVNDQLTKSVSSITNETNHINVMNNELQTIATSLGSTTERIVQLCTEQQTIQQQIYQNLHNTVLQQMITIILQSDTNQNYILSQDEVTVLIERIKLLPGITVNENAFRSVLNQSEPKGTLTIPDLCTIVRNMQQHQQQQQTTTSNEESIEISNSEFGDPVFIFQPKDLLL